MNGALLTQPVTTAVKSTAPDPTAADSGARTLAAYWSAAAERFADRTALRADEVELTYRELDRRARVLAATLKRDGLGAGEICGIYLDRSPDCVIAMLAVTLTGAAWLPLDPAYPPGRLRLMAEDARLRFLISDRDTTALRLDPAPRVYRPDAAADDILDRAANAVPGPAKPSDPAYVIFTSGSTGRPKGVQIEHRSLLLFLDAMRDLLPPASLRRVLSISSPSFDISLLEVFLPLGNGGMLILAPTLESRDGRLLAARLDAERPTLLQATPATWRMLLAAGWRGHDDLVLLTGAEVIPPAMAGALLERADGLWNLYGPTEATVWATAGRITSDDVAAGAIPIGRPLDHLQIRVLDENRVAVADGEVGELYLLGPGLSPGYLARPDLTAERFLVLPEGRAYRSGDRVSLRPDGQLAFHGRVDSQLKLNSIRIEPGEVEAVLRDHPGLRDVAVAAKTIGEGDPRLVAYLVPEDFDPGQQRRRRLAEHWRGIWSREYREARAAQADPTFNIAGLRSSYDGQLVASDALREMVEQSCDRVRALAPKRILDLGCGSGLLLHRLAPDCERYLGVDFSAEAIADLTRDTRRLGLTQVELLQQGVDRADGIEAGGFDVVLLNTVIQYFPDVDYVAAVLDNALRALRPGGVVFVGDVRELAALPAFQASVVFAKAAGADLDPGTLHEDNRAALRQELQRLADRENELAFDPGWFEAFGETRSDIAEVAFAYKHGRFANEFMDYRYDVILRKGPTAQEMPAAESLMIREIDLQDGTVPALSRLWSEMNEHQESSLLIKGLRNSRRHDAFAGLQVLQAGHAEETAALDLDRGCPCNPDELVREARARGYCAAILPDPLGSAAHFAALLLPMGPGVTIWSHRPRDGAARPLPARLSNELQQSLATPGRDHADLIADLQRRAAAHLPGPMCPSHYVVLRELPLTPSRKLDRAALPLPRNSRPTLPQDFVAPRDALELQIASLMAEALGISPVGASDGFFELGGDSLATVELLLALQERFDVDIALPAFLERPTPEGLAEMINTRRGFRPSSALVTLRPDGSAPPLFFIHGAGGLAFTVFELGQALQGDHPVFALQDPACDPAVDPANRIEDMAAALIAQIKTVQASGPYRLCGHSFGGLLAFEMAVQLRAAGQDVDFLGMLDTPTPPTAKGRGLGAHVRLWWRELRFQAQILTQAWPMAMDGCYVLFGAEARYRNRVADRDSAGGALRRFWADAMFRYFHRRAGLASAVDRDSRLLMMRQPGIRRSIRLTAIHDEARRRYHPGRFDGTVFQFRATVPSAETSGFSDDALGWDRHAAEVTCHRVPGSHFTMTRGDNATHLARALEQVLHGQRLAAAE